jgi:hypothetical protein
VFFDYLKTAAVQGENVYGTGGNQLLSNMRQKMAVVENYLDKDTHIST